MTIGAALGEYCFGAGQGAAARLVQSTLRRSAGLRDVSVLAIDAPLKA
ncbi:MAG: hypothetical protein GY796_23045 [Chloroflexi bacterium]|nr:hypothetical protein [Chloroflexota bacterium]